ncbi:transposase [Pseudomonas sp. NPDC077382]
MRQRLNVASSDLTVYRAALSSLKPGQSVSVVARRNGISPNQLLHWRKFYHYGGTVGSQCRRGCGARFGAGDAMKQIRELQRMLGNKNQMSPDSNAAAGMRR